MEPVLTFSTWTEYFGPVGVTTDTIPGVGERRSTIYGFETISEEHRPATETAIIAESGAVFGYVVEGVVTISDRQSRIPTTLTQGEYFSVNAPVHFAFTPTPTRVVAVHVDPFVALRTIGGPIEPKGRLRYIDRCSDSLLIGPPMLSDPCLNLLHFPPGIHQTAHTHPSVRCGAIADGAGYCINGDGERLDLLPGMIWVIPAETVHSFHTVDSGSTLNVIAYHPDTDFGPQDENHPMLNRTWVDGKPVDNTTDAHADADVMRFP